MKSLGSCRCHKNVWFTSIKNLKQESPATAKGTRDSAAVHVWKPAANKI